MATAALSPELMREAIEAWKACGENSSQAADRIGIPRPTFQHRLKRAIALGFDDKIVSEAPVGHAIKGVSTLYRPDGSVVAQWVKTRADAPSIEDITTAIRAALDGYEPPAPAPAPETTIPSLATVYPLADWHVGLLAWRRETGDDWDLNIARHVISQAMQRLVSQSPPSEQGVVIGLGDLLHADNYQNRTSRSGHVLDVDGRWPKVLRVSTELVIEAVDLALTRHSSVLVRLIPGNHDDQSAIAVSLALAFHYANNPRVTVDDDPGPFWWWLWGAVFLGAAHGDQAKMADLPLIMASMNPESWGASKHRLILTGHIHHRSKLVAAKEYGGVEVESFNTPVAKDAWQHRAGYVSGRSVHSITFHKTEGEIGRARANILTA
jgi:hypothetical protein